MSEGPTKKVLLVEDNRGDACLIQQMLTAPRGARFELIRAERLSTALQRLGEGGIDVVLLDLTLPDSEGLHGLERMQAAHPEVPIVVVTACEDEELALNAVRAGAQDYLLKSELDSPLLVRALCYAVERKREQEALRRSEAKYRTLFEQSGDGLYVAARDGEMVDASRSWSELFGYGKEEIAAGLNVEALYADPADLRRFQDEIEREGSVRDFEVMLHRKDGTQVDCSVSAIARRADDGIFLGYRAIVRDITEQKRLELQLRLSQRLEAVGRLAGGVAHDFNNLLMVIMGGCALLERDLDSEHPEQRREIEEIKLAANRAGDLTRQLLAFSRRQVLRPRMLDLNCVVSDLEKMLPRVIGEDIELRTVLERELGSVKADPAQIEHVIMQLAVNARDAMRDGGVLTVETANVELDEEYARRHVPTQPGFYVMLAVTDTGAGIDEMDRALIFEPFFTTKKLGEGSGLGLSTVYGIVKQSGGYIWVDSEPARGTAFKIYLPRIERASEPSEPSPFPTPAGPGSETVLVVEDEEAVRRLVCAVLRRCGYTVLEAPDGEAALQICERHEERIHLVVTDVVMPHMSGRELADRLAASQEPVKVLYMSGYTDDAILQHGVLEPGTAFLQKPFIPDVLVQKVREVLDAPWQER